MDGGAGERLAPGPGRWRCSWQPWAGEDSALPGQVSPLPLPGPCSAGLLHKEVWGARANEAKWLTSRQSGRVTAGQAAQVTPSQGELRQGGLGAAAVPGGKGISRESGGRWGRAASEGDDPAHGGRSGPGADRTRRGTQVSGPPAATSPTAVHLVAGTGAALAQAS